MFSCILKVVFQAASFIQNIALDSTLLVEQSFNPFLRSYEPLISKPVQPLICLIAQMTHVCAMLLHLARVVVLHDVLHCL